MKSRLDCVPCIVAQSLEIGNGCAGAGTHLAACSPEFRRRFERADLVNAKGQANFESSEGSERDIFFLFKVKRPVIARPSGHALGKLVIHRNVPVCSPAGTFVAEPK